MRRTEDDATHAAERLARARARRRENIRDTIFGFFFVALGISVFRFNPEHAGYLPILLAAFGGVLINRRLIKVLGRRGVEEGGDE